MWSFKRYGGIMLLLYFVSWIHEWIISSTNKSSLLAISKKSFCNMLWISINHPQQSLSCWGLCINQVSIFGTIVNSLIFDQNVQDQEVEKECQRRSILSTLHIFLPTFPHFSSFDWIVVACPGHVLVFCDFSFNELSSERKN